MMTNSSNMFSLYHQVLAAMQVVIMLVITSTQTLLDVLERLNESLDARIYAVDEHTDTHIEAIMQLETHFDALEEGISTHVEAIRKRLNPDSDVESIDTGIDVRSICTDIDVESIGRDIDVKSINTELDVVYVTITTRFHALVTYQ
ncbi:hypothetical protein B0I37DRAFT_382364 [Chaetomium sp. MPI-CAGE-AT-0009]|nr:hypothetical protein B0I37DRAFT_382364 [Chaetomium sp. MPI-CAGE-AT-0009]